MATHRTLDGEPYCRARADGTASHTSHTNGNTHVYRTRTVPQALRDYVTSSLTPTGVAKLLRGVADVDRQLYATAVHAQALAVQGGNLELDAFCPQMRTLLKQVCDTCDQNDIKTYSLPEILKTHFLGLWHVCGC